MQIIVNPHTDPAFNLALEEALLKAYDRDVFMLWQNAPSIIVGRNQNTMAEVDYNYVTERGLPVIRRLTGGGAVYHDLGNLNFTIILRGAADKFTDFSFFTRPVISALKGFGIAAETGKNDILFGGKKISGNAQCVYKGSLLHHGTLLFNVDTETLSRALTVSRKKIESKGIASVKSRVTNLNIDITAFSEKLTELIKTENAGSEITEIPPEIRAEADRLNAEKYSTYAWNYGYSPKYTFSSDAYGAYGGIQVYLDIEGGVIRAAKIYGDFNSLKGTAELENALTACEHNMEQVRAALKKINLSEHISGITGEEFARLLF